MTQKTNRELEAYPSLKTPEQLKSQCMDLYDQLISLTHCLKNEAARADRYKKRIDDLETALAQEPVDFDTRMDEVEDADKIWASIAMLRANRKELESIVTRHTVNDFERCLLSTLTPLRIGVNGLDELAELYISRIPENEMSKRFVGGFIRGLFADLKHNRISGPYAAQPTHDKIDLSVERKRPKDKNGPLPLDQNPEWSRGWNACLDHLAERYPDKFKGEK